MDLILDTNIYESDFRMAGALFKSLFDYLRKSKHSLILPRIVSEETMARYRTRLRQSCNKVDDCWSEFRYLVLTNEPQLQRPDIDQECTELLNRLKSPAKGVSVHFVETLEGVSVDEIYMRGIQRRAPANSNGEELRDVILWLFVLSHASRTGQPIAFITRDGDYWRKEKPRNEIVEDIQRRKVQVELYRDIEHFLKANALKPEPVSTEWATQHFDISQFREQIIALITVRLPNQRSELLDSRFFVVNGVDIQNISFSRGQSFQIDDDHAFAELDFLIEAIVDLSLTTAPAGPARLVDIGRRNVERLAPRWPGATQHAPVWRTLQSGGSSLQLGLTQAPQDVTDLRFIIGKDKCWVKALASFSIRLERGKATETELTKFNIEEVSEVEQARDSEDMS